MDKLASQVAAITAGIPGNEEGEMEDYPELQMKVLQMQKSQQFLQELLTNKATLRDQFAMAALQGLLGNSVVLERHGLASEEVTIHAYEYADAMLRAREAKP